jgi:two-component system KDP operon response regulator KdpE
MERVEFALQRTRTTTSPRQEFIHDNLVIDWRRFEVRIDGQLVHLGPIEFRLLSLLVQRQDEVVTYGEILTKVWGSNYDLAERRNIKQYIWYLRQKIERDPSQPRWIQTKPGVGYIFCPEEPEPVLARRQQPLHAEAMLAS